MTELRASNYTLSPSTFDAAEACPAARVYRGPKSEMSHGMWHGIAVHRFIQYWIERSPAEALAYVAKKFPKRLAYMRKLDMSVFPAGMAEAQFVINAREEVAVLLSSYDNVRSEADPTTCVTVKTDLYVPGDAPVVVDYKTGVNAVDPRTNTQSMLEALAAWLLHERIPDVVRASVYTIVGGEITQRHHDWTREDLENAMQRTRRVHLELIETRADFRHGVEPDFNPGDHCYRCQANMACPQKKESPGPPAKVPRNKK